MDTTTTGVNDSPRLSNAYLSRLRPLGLGLLNARSIGNKSSIVATIITENSHDVFLLTETWHTFAEDTALRRCVPPAYACVEAASPPKNIAVMNHGSIAAVITNRLNHKVI